MIYALLSKKCCESHLRNSVGQIAQDVWFGGGRGGHPNLGNAWIFGTFGLVTLVTPPKPILLLLYDRWK